MNRPDRTHYEVLGLTRNAKAHEVRRAYDRLRKEMQGEAAPPNPIRLVRLQTAFEVLSDEARREAYDESLRAPPKRALPGRRALAAGGAAAIVLVALAIVLATRQGPAPRKDRAVILSSASVSVGRLRSIDLAGRVTPLGLAFAIGDGRLAAACPPAPAGAELSIRIGERDVPARLEPQPSARTFCLLHAPGAGSWPLAIADAAPALGEPVQAVRIGEDGGASLAEGRIARIERGGAVAVLEVSGDASRASPGTPLLDAQGRVIAIGEAPGRYVAMRPGDAPAR